MALRTPATLSVARACASDCISIDTYFDELEQTLEENGLLDKPCLVFTSNKIATKAGVAYVPLYTPVKRRLSNSANVCIKFTEEEQEEFQQMYDDVSDDDDYNGGDNPRYRSWLQMYHFEMLSDSPCPHHIFQQ